MNAKGKTARWPEHRLALRLGGVVIAVFLIGMGYALNAAALGNNAIGVMLVVFNPVDAQENVIKAIFTSGARPVRPVFSSFVWIVFTDQEGSVGRMKQQGAIAAFDELPLTPTFAGCFSYVDPKKIKLIDLHPH